MLKIQALKSEAAAAFLTAGMISATPAFAQSDDDTNTSNYTAPETVSSVPSRVWYNDEIPVEFFYGLLLLGAAGTAYAGYRRTEGTFTRTLALSVGFAAIANPQNVVDEYRIMPTIFPVFVDKSPSIGNRASYVGEAFENLETTLANLGPSSVIKVPFGDEGGRDARTGTNLTDALRATLNTVPEAQLGGAFVISDGILYDQSRYMDVEDIGAPVHALIAGPDSEQDFHLTFEQAPRIGMADEDQQIRFRVVDERSPNRTDMSANVTVSYGGEHVTKMTVPVNKTQSFMLSDLNEEGLQIGRNVIEIEINTLKGEADSLTHLDESAQPEEVTFQNNHITSTIEGISPEIKVLLLSGKPHSGTGLWRTLLKNDSNVSLTHLGFLRPPAKEDATPLRELATVAFPAKEILEEKINAFDVIIMDDYKYSQVIPPKYFQNIYDYTREGGGLLITGSESLAASTGMPNTILGDILPFAPDGSVMERGFTPEVTKEGKRHPVGQSLLNGAGQQSWGPWYSMATGTARVDALTLMSDGNNNPLVTLGNVGEGRVVVVSSDQNAVWASGHQGGGPATSLYRSLTGWLSENPRYAEENLTLHKEDGAIILKLQTMKDTPEPVILTTPSGKEIEVMPEQIQPGIFTARLEALENGAYRARRSGDAGTKSTIGMGIDDRTEIENVISETEILRPLTDKTQGLTVRIVDPKGTVKLPQIAAIGDDTVNNSDALRVNMDAKRELVGRDTSPIWPMWGYTALFTGLMMASFREKEILDALTPGRKDINNGPDAPNI